MVGRQLFIQLRLSLKHKWGEYRFASEMRSLELVSVLSHCIYLSDSQQDGRGGWGCLTSVSTNSPYEDQHFFACLFYLLKGMH